MTWLARALHDFPRRFGRIVASGTYVPQIDGLRFLAIMQVAIYHSALRGNRAFLPSDSPSDGLFAWFPNGAAGVELFFFISGYIIAFPFLSGRAPALGAFFKRRLFRLEPPYLIALLLCFLLLSLSGYRPAEAVAFNKSDAPLWQSLAASSVYLHGIIFGAPPRLNPPLWSLEIEIQFYVLAPLLLFAYQAVRSPRLRLALGAIVLVAAIVSQPLLTRDHNLNYLLISHFYAFWLGILCCDVAVRHNPFAMSARPLYDVALVVGLGVFLFTSTLFYAFGSAVYVAATLALRAASIVLIYIGAARGPWGRRILGHPWITLIGGACYSIYLTHVPVLQATASVVFRFVHPRSVVEAWILGPVLCLPVALVVGLVYYVYIERPCMRRDWPKELAMAVAVRLQRKGSRSTTASPESPRP